METGGSTLYRGLVIINISFVKEELEGGVGAGCKILAPLAPSNKLFI